MKLVDSGEGKVPLVSVIAILAISLIVNLPGLAISPVLGKIKAEFPHSTALEVQLLNVLPNFLTIPFIMGAGKICTPKNQLTVLVIGLALFAATGIGYFFAKSMIVLILLGCLIGVGAGLVIPLAASLISQNFSGKPRGIVLGAKSGLSNLSLIIATLFVGWVAAHNWHMAFIVYFLPLVPLVLVPFIRNKFINKSRPAPMILSQESSEKSQSFHFKGKAAKDMMWFALIIYFALSYGALVISYYLPFTMEAYGLSTGKVGVATSMFYLAATLAGFGLSKILKATGIWTFQLGMILVALSLLGIGFIHTYASYIIGVFILGLGYGVIQPVLYDKTSYFAPTDAKATEYFSWLLTSSYIALAGIPFIVEFFGTFIKGRQDPSFPFILNGVLMGILAIIVVVKHKNFVVQAGVIPQGKGIVEQPSSAIAPGVRYVSTSLEDNDQKIRESVESALAESEAPVGVPMSVSAPPPSSALSPSSHSGVMSSVPPVEISSVSPSESSESLNIAPAPSIKPAESPDKDLPLSPAPIYTAGKTAEIMKAAETSLDQARNSLKEMRRQQALLLKQEAQSLEIKAREIHEEAQQLLEEANALDAQNDENDKNLTKNSDNINPNAT